ncbi:MAG: dihydrolipoyl dehydrogenase [Nitrososphaeria archaeon]|jgi:dihydrolipoamide dehydrogenase
MKEYDAIAIGTGSVIEIVNALIYGNPKAKVAVIDKDEPGGICLTRGCIPSKILLYPAEVVRTIEKAKEFGIHTTIEEIDFKAVMDRMRKLIYEDIESIRMGLTHMNNIDYYPTVAEFISPYMLKVGDDAIHSGLIFLGAGSKPTIPKIDGLDSVKYYTSDTFLKMDVLPKSTAIIGGGYIAAEYGHFLSAMGSEVTIIGRNPKFIPEEEPEISALAKREFQKHMIVMTGLEVRRVENASANKKKVTAVNRVDGEEVVIEVDEILVASGRSSNSDILHPERGGIKTDKEGWIIVDKYLQTSQPNVWALGDADGKYMFKHVANYEALVVYYNAVLGKKMEVDYHAVPHAIFAYPEVASVGLKEKEALERYGSDDIVIGVERYEDTAKGLAMNVKDYFVKVIVEKKERKILGAHVIGPSASILIQEIINLMYTPSQSVNPITQGMHIHPSLSEVVQRAFGSLVEPEEYHHIITEHYKLPKD